MAEIGFVKVAENNYGACYQRENNEYNYTQRLDIIHMHSGYNTATEYVKAAIIEFDKVHRIKPEALKETEEGVRTYAPPQDDLTAMLEIITRKDESD